MVVIESRPETVYGAATESWPVYLLLVEGQSETFGFFFFFIH